MKAEGIEHRAKSMILECTEAPELLKSPLGDLGAERTPAAMEQLAVGSMQLAEGIEHRAESREQEADRSAAKIPPYLTDMRREGNEELAVRSMQLKKDMVSGYIDAPENLQSPLGDLGAKRSMDSHAIESTPWLVVKTKTKCEKYVRDKIQAMGMDAFVPVTRRTARYQRKVKVYEYPLISCYTFVRLDQSRRNQVLGLPYVQGMLRLNGKDCQVTTEEIRWLQQVSGTAMDISAETWSMQTGDHVMIAAGQLAGMEGIIVSRRSKHEVVLGLESLGLQLVIQVDPAMLVRV